MSSGERLGKEGQIIVSGLDPDRIARHLSSEATPMKDMLLRDRDTKEVVRRIPRWEIALSDRLSGDQTSIVIEPENKRVVISIEGKGGRNSFHFNDVGDVEYSKTGGEVTFVRETEEIRYQIGVNSSGRVQSVFREEKEYADDGLIVDTRDL